MLIGALDGCSLVLGLDDAELDPSLNAPATAGAAGASAGEAAAVTDVTNAGGAAGAAASGP
jgi:hypothetical protein